MNRSSRTYKLCVITGSRAEYGLLVQLLRAIIDHPDLQLQLIATGMHISPELGMTKREIEADGFEISATVETHLSSDTAIGTAKSAGLGLIGFADTFARLMPDAVIVLGDRYENWAAASTAHLMRLPLVHIGGGDLPAGAFDEALRHGISKMADLHLVTHPAAATVVRQLGEAPASIHVVGHPGIDRMLDLPRLSRSELTRQLGIGWQCNNYLITFHPETRSRLHPDQAFCELLHALDTLPDTPALIFTKSNADPGGQSINRMIDDYVASGPHRYAFTSLGQLPYFSIARHVQAVIGNSSSAICEIPSLGVPSINIGSRQSGRTHGESVFSCQPNAESIRLAIHDAEQWRASGRAEQAAAHNPYGQGDSSIRMISVIRKWLANEPKRPKTFCLLTDGTSTSS